MYSFWISTPKSKKMAQKVKNVKMIEPTVKGTSIGRKPIFSSMNKHKRRNHKAYRGQGR